MGVGQRCLALAHPPDIFGSYFSFGGYLHISGVSILRDTHETKVILHIHLCEKKTTWRGGNGVLPLPTLQIEPFLFLFFDFHIKELYAYTLTYIHIHLHAYIHIHACIVGGRGTVISPYPSSKYTHPLLFSLVQNCPHHNTYSTHNVLHIHLCNLEGGERCSALAHPPNIFIYLYNEMLHTYIYIYIHTLGMGNGS